MEWKDEAKQSGGIEEEDEGGMKEDGGGLLVKVISDEQMDLLRKQIAVYAAISQQLLQMHRACSAHLDLPGVMRWGNPYLDPAAVGYGGSQKIAARQRWSPTPVQLQILEGIFDESGGTPGKQRIQIITTELAQHGQISETNVYNWFQNRRARMKRKQPPPPSSKNEESEDKAHVDEKKMNLATASINSSENSAARTENIYYIQTPDIGFEQVIGKMEVPESFSFYLRSEPYDML